MGETDFVHRLNEGDLAFGPTSTPYGVTYSEWTARWWKWALETPKTRNPLFDLTGRWSDENQAQADVWFLAGTLIGVAKRIERNCTIPHGKAVLFPISNHESSFVEFPSLQTESELRAVSEADIDKVTKLMVAIDGVLLSELYVRRYRIRSPMFTINLPEDNILDKPAGQTFAVSDGYWMFLKPLSLGKHTLNFLGSCATDELFIEAVYHIDIEEE